MFSNLLLRAAPASVVAALMVAAPASAVSTIKLADSECLLATGCKFSGNIAPKSVRETQDAYNAAKAIDIELNFLGKSDDGFGTVTGGAAGTGTWTVPGFNIDYYAVKSGNNFILYSVLPGATSVSYNTAGLQQGKNRNLPSLSHIAFFGSVATAAVPEPAMWAMMVTGFGFVGGAMRRRTSAAQARVSLS